MDEATATQLEVPQEPTVRILSQEERNDLRKRVLAGQELTVEEARAVFQTLRQSQGGVVLTGESTKKGRKPKKEAMSDAALDASLDAKLGL